MVGWAVVSNCLFRNDILREVYRRTNERYLQCYLAEHYGADFCMVGAVVSFEATPDLVFIPSGGRGGAFINHQYIEDILGENVVPYTSFMTDDFLIMQGHIQQRSKRGWYPNFSLASA